MEIKCLSLGNPDEGFTNYFVHADELDSLAMNLELDHTSDLVKALRFEEWQVYSGNQLANRSCCVCGKALEDNALQEPGTT